MKTEHANNMKTISKILYFAIAIFTIVACAEKHEDADKYLQDIKHLYENGDYKLAKQRIDSMEALFPKAFDQRKAALSLLQDVRKAESTQQVNFADSAITSLNLQIDSLKKLFTYDINKKYQEKGRYIPKGGSSHNALTATTVRSYVSEDGIFNIESVYVGGGKFHNKMKVSTKDGSYMETLPVTDDGLNFRFTDSGRQYEVIQFSGASENGVGKFVDTFVNAPITVTLSGKSTTSFPLSPAIKKSISDSYRLASLISTVDSINSIKIVAEKQIEYLNSKAQKTVQPTE